MRILLLGGTVFLGRALAADALQRGYDVTTFNRGRSGPDLPRVTAIRGDRTSDEDLEVLAARGPWDAVIDTSGMTTPLVEASTRALARSVGRYILISTVNVYTGWPTDPLDDDSPVREYTPVGPPGESGADEYGRLKAGAELAVTTTYASRATLLRPGVILGPHENVGRLPWWLNRVQDGGRILAPGRPDWPIQPIDVRDVARFALDAAERDLAGSYNLTAPIGSSTIGELLGLCQEVTGVKGELEWVADAFLREQGVPEWVGLPLWRDYPGTWHVDAARARGAGLVCRPLAATVADTWEWVRGGIALEGERFAELGISRQREEQILAAWDARRGGD
ncbi:NAD-dependent epimerase/dehydratase family protein [Planomonospora sp. ID82291]|uniref:NAD-dependent epimerase/dehydratase family protein n=1 Tax=Planomonospora sp. ID82291 TaxID=2738136 RepID=UPI0018C35A6B|nr:NAD-dependent epimerase/dehydratase family protein [Planomonospora sp. ID82291]MBG0818434.1 NAD-dependent epimerase/dehydratase family protein [Planomonospora sp. ID82291]